MKDPSLWIFFSVLFIVAGALNFARALRDSGGRRNARFALAASCVLWAIACAAFRFLGDIYGLGIGSVAAVVMIGASILKMRDTK